jgi:hypothetical protein
MWCKNLKQDIIGIPLNKEVNPWRCSSPSPETQLAQLKSMGFIGEFKDYEKNTRLADLVEGKKIAIEPKICHTRKKT